MSAQASDIQQVVSKTQAVERLYQTQKQQPDNDQQKFAANVQQQADEKNLKTQDTTKTENRKIDEKHDKLTLSSKKRNKKKKKGKNGKKDDEAENKFDENVGQILDIKV